MKEQKTLNNRQLYLKKFPKNAKVLVYLDIGLISTSNLSYIYLFYKFQYNRVNYVKYQINLSNNILEFKLKLI